MSDDDKELDALIEQAERFLRDAGFYIYSVGGVSVRAGCDPDYPYELRLLFNGVEPKHGA